MGQTLSEQINRIKNLIEQTEPIKGECGITRACSKEEKEAEKQNRAANIQSSIQQKIDLKDMAKEKKLSLDLDYNYLNDKRDKDDKNTVRNLYNTFDKNLLLGGRYNDEQKFAALYKVFENIKRRPQLSYAIRLRQKYPTLDYTSVTLQQLAKIASELTWDKFVDWFLSGGPSIT